MKRQLAESGPPPVSYALLLGADLPEMARNQRRNFDEDRIALVEAVCRRAQKWGLASQVRGVVLQKLQQQIV